MITSLTETEMFNFYNELTRIHSQMNSLKISKLDIWEELNEDLKRDKNTSLAEAMSAIEKALYLTNLSTKKVQPASIDDLDEDDLNGLATN